MCIIIYKLGTTVECKQKIEAKVRAIDFYKHIIDKQTKVQATKFSIMTYDPVQKCSAPATGYDWNILYWILGTICMPVALPLVFLNLWRRSVVANERKRLPGKVVLITGASSGLGEALAHAFYKAGCKVILAARRIDELERVRKDLLSLEVVSCCCCWKCKLV